MNEQTAARPGRAVPRHAIVVLLDSLNRHMISSYGGTEFDTPNLQRFAARALRFDCHLAGSLPCMPARHDILVGSQDFLWRPWGSVEVWEDALTYHLRQAGVTTMLVSDHPHLFEAGGENYHTDFTAWEYLRGHEGDPWRTRPDPSWMGTPEEAVPCARRPMPYDISRTWFRDESDYPGPKTMTAAAAWLRANHDAHSRFMLFVDEFDPHEPFDTPEPWAGRYDLGWTGSRLIWPPYSRRTLADGVLNEREARHVRANYGAKLSMIDHWFGRILDVLDETGLWSETAVIVTTDHGHYLGEHDLFGKPASTVYREIGHIPLLIAWPGVAAGNVGALTATVDIHATLADLFGVTSGHTVHGRSLIPLIFGDRTSVREHALYGVWGREVGVSDGRWRYSRGPAGDNFPLAMWSNRWSTMPLYGQGREVFPRPDRRAALDFMPGSEVPVIRQPFQPGDLLPYWAGDGRTDGTRLFDTAEDPAETRDLAGTPAEKAAVELLRAGLEDIEAPPEQLQRLGLA
jgi:arylsulfatase A-like enzyme